MNYTKEETIENYKIKYRKHIFSKSIRITLKNNNTVLITLPVLCPFKVAREFFIKNFEKIKTFKPNNEILKPDFKTKFETLKINKSNILKIQTIKNIVHFYYPENQAFNSKEIQEKYKEAIKKAIKIEAKNYLPARLEFLAKKFNFKFNKVTLKNQKTRFGSCSFQNNINLNINLMLYDFEIIDYVLIHELVHTKIKNHSIKFWNEVEKYCPQYKEIRKKLKQKSFI